MEHGSAQQRPGVFGAPLLPDMGTIQSEADIRAFMPSKHASVDQAHASLERTSSHSLRKRKSHHGASVKTLHPPVSHRRSIMSNGQVMIDKLDPDDMVPLDDDEKWRRLEQIKSLTSSMDVKRKTRSQVISTPTAELQGFRKWRYDRVKEWKRMQRRWREALADWEVWRGSFKVIEGQFGSAVVSYFHFLKWLFWLNLVLSIAMLCVVVFPQEFLKPNEFVDSINLTVNSPVFVKQAENCSAEYDKALSVQINGSAISDQVIDFIQGTGWMEKTPLFYGYYFNKTFVWLDDVESRGYIMPLAYLLTIIAYFVVSLLLMVRYTANGVKESLTHSGDKFYQYCDKVFSGWDYNLTKGKTATLKHKNLYREYKNDLVEQRRALKMKSMPWYKKCSMFFVRVFINLIVLAVLVASAYLIVFTSEQTAQLSTRDEIMSNDILSLLVQFLPSITITVLNVIVPVLFQKIVLAEDYTPDTELKVTIFRTVLLRLASIAVLVVTLNSQVLGCSDADYTCGNCQFNCWETYVGQQFFKLVLLDFIVIVAVTFFVEFPRKLVVRRYTDFRIVQLVGLQEFEIPKNVLDLVYSQALCWLGAVFSPLIPAITVVKFFIYFYVKKLTLLHNCIPSSRPYQASRSNTFFMTILLISFVLCAVPIVYTITKVSPSQSCGPFRVYSTAEFVMFGALTDAVTTWPAWFSAILSFLSSWTFYVPLAVILCLVIYYFVAVAAGSRRMIELLKEQLALEGKDKQFLLNQVRQALIYGEIPQQ